MCNKHISSSYLTPLFTGIKLLNSNQLNRMYEYKLYILEIELFIFGY